MARTPSTDDVAPASPLTPRARRTKAALLASARTVFERDGFHNARITDIADGAKVSHGTFYTYFDGKETIFLALVDGMIADLFHDRPEQVAPADESVPTAYERLERTNREYLKVYRDNGRIISIWEELATFNEGAAERLRLGMERFVSRSERQIARLQAEGRADTRLDPRYAARALTSMVHRFAYTWFGQGESYDFETAVENLTRLWANALQMDEQH
ncbi:MAG: transcriptional regulator, TetR family [Nocardioides sp.]|nr:transcriptional regulator, TetR family [Nocardioides sp.]